ncbi:putative ABC transporter [Hyperthermus butylicus DSM 5456]|uniref:ABC transporter n=2 Tax=Hyperthermus butylicus TaxID=54248 RepID=A2BLK6_HYPBU|nr:putative ABC transporter [Hyperthermus butylicus DSM 5456]
MSVMDKPLAELSREDIIEFSRKRGEPEWVLRLRLKAYEYIRSTSYDPSIDPYMEKVTYRQFLEGLEKPLIVDEQLAKAARRLGIRPDELEIIYSGFSVNIDNVVIKTVLKMLEKRGVILTSMDEAVKRYPVVKDYAFRGLHPTLSKKVAYHVMLWAGGIFVYVPEGVRLPQPIQGLFIIGKEGLSQTEHTLIVLEEGAELHWIEGCTAPLRLSYGVHLGGLEAFVKDRARLFVVSINNWPGDVHHTPAKRVIVEGYKAYAELTSVSLAAKTVNVAPRIDLRGQDSTAVIQNIGLYRGNQVVRSSPLIVYEAPGTRGQLLNRTVVKDSADEEFRGRLEVRRGAKGATGFMSCNTLIIGDKARSAAIPAIASEERDSELSHEASVGRISYEKLYYLQLMGFDEEEATWLIVSGFFDPVIKKLPFDIQIEVRKILELAVKGH